MRERAKLTEYISRNRVRGWSLAVFATGSIDIILAMYMYTRITRFTRTRWCWRRKYRFARIRKFRKKKKQLTGFASSDGQFLSSQWYLSSIFDHPWLDAHESLPRFRDSSSDIVAKRTASKSFWNLHKSAKTRSLADLTEWWRFIVEWCSSREFYCEGHPAINQPRLSRVNEREERLKYERSDRLARLISSRTLLAIVGRQ